MRRELDDNPALEVGEEAPEQEDSFNESAEQLQMADYATDDDIPGYRLDAHNRSADDPYYEPMAVASESLYDYLLSQLSEITGITASQRETAAFIIGNLDSNGYMTRSVSAIADDMSISSGTDTTVEEVRRVWDIVRTLDPAGVGAVDLRDCLLLQLGRMPRLTAVTELATEIIRDYFDLFSLLHFKQISSLTGRTPDEIREAVDLIKTLNPKPGNAVDGSAGDDPRLRHITPDFLVEYDDESHRLSLTLLHRLPHLEIERSFATDLPAGTANSRSEREARTFIKMRREQAQSFIQVINMRQQTLYTVMRAIMQWQNDFFISGDPLRLRPMVLKDIASVTGYDLTVVSRVTMNKYVATSRGVYSLKSLFNERRKEGDDTSRNVVLDKLRTLIEHEDKSDPLSDDALTRALQADGYDIARRTVAKYREMLQIPVARLRRTF